MTGREALHGALHRSECPIDKCASCLEIMDPGDVGRVGGYVTRSSDVMIWLRFELPEYWWSTDSIALAGVADWLLSLRDAVEAGRWKR